MAKDLALQRYAIKPTKSARSCGKNQLIIVKFNLKKHRKNAVKNCIKQKKTQKEKK
jgi:hypothetical protein